MSRSFLFVFVGVKAQKFSRSWNPEYGKAS